MVKEQKMIFTESKWWKELRRARLAAMIAAAGLLIAPAAVMADDPPEDDEEDIVLVKPPEGKDITKPEAAAPVINAATTKKVYLVPLRGEIGHEVSMTSMRRVVDDAKKHDIDYLVFFADFTWSFNGKQIMGERDSAMLSAWNQVGKVQEIQSIFTDAIRDDPTWTKKPKVIFWVRRAMGGAAFLPLVCKDIYFTPDARLGGIGFLDRMFDGRGDETVREKQRSLRLGWVQGMGQKGGYSDNLIRGMARSDIPLSFTLVGGKPEYHWDLSGEDTLMDAGKIPDTLDQIIRLEGNDTLTLNAERAKKLGVSKANIENIDALMFELGIERDYQLIAEPAAKIMKRWAEDLNKAERDVNKLFNDYRRVVVEGPTPTDRNRGRGRQISILLEMKRIIEKYEGSINPAAIRGAPKDFIGQINVRIDEIRTEMRLDR